VICRIPRALASRTCAGELSGIGGIPGVEERGWVELPVSQDRQELRLVDRSDIALQPGSDVVVESINEVRIVSRFSIRKERAE